MRKVQKQLLGLAGLAAVGAMTAAACMMPSPNAAAQSIYGEQASSDGDFQVQVTVIAGVSNVTTATPANNAEYNTQIIPVAISYEKLSRMVSTLSYIGEDDNLVEVEVNNFVPEAGQQDSGVNRFSLDLSQYRSKNGEYKLTTQGYNLQGEPLQKDVVQFKYTSTVVTPEPTPEEGGNPSIDVNINDDVETVVIQVWDKDGNPIFVDKNGNPTPIELGRDAFDENGNLKVKLPLEEYGVKEGEYTVTIDSYDKNGENIAMKTVKIYYKPVTPEIPNSGNLMADFNISRVDYIVTGIIIFALVAGAGIYMALRKSRR